MRFSTTHLRWLAPLLVSTIAQAQAFNIDVGPNLILWPEPSPAYAAAAGQSGIWNAVRNPFAGDVLVGLTGATTAVSLSSNVTSSFSYPFGSLGPDDDAFTSDGQAISSFGPLAAWTFTGLSDGAYQLYTYCWDPANSGVLTQVTLAGEPNSTQNVGGIWNGSPHALGLTYALHSVTVTGGTFGVEASALVSGDSGTVLGFQLVPATNANDFCFGDGSGASCPCGNFGAPGTGCANSSGAGASLQVMGTTSVSSDDITFSMLNGPGPTPALLFAGTDQVNGGLGTPFGDGLRCAGGQIQRLGVMIQDQGGSATWGPGLAPLGGWSAGDTRFFQAWYRDSTNSPCAGNFNLTQGVQVVFIP